MVRAYLFQIRVKKRIIIPRNNIVWEVKHLCLVRQTILFDEWNNIVSSVEVKISNSETLVLWFENNYLVIFTSGLFRKTFDWELWYWQVCVSFSFLADDIFVPVCVCMQAIIPRFWQCVFCESPEKARFAHKLAVGCEEGHSQAIRLTLWQSDSLSLWLTGNFWRAISWELVLWIGYLCKEPWLVIYKLDFCVSVFWPSWSKYCWAQLWQED